MTETAFNSTTPDYTGNNKYYTGYDILNQFVKEYP